MKHYSLEDFEGKMDSLYRLVIVASKRAGQVNRPESRSLVATHSKKPTVIALEEILEGKVSYTTGARDEEDFLE